MTTLTEKRCVPCEGQALPLTLEKIQYMLNEIPEWQTIEEPVSQIYRTFQFENYYQTMAFANAISWIAHQENHHPYLEIGYNSCMVRYWTHAIKGLSSNDFICAVKVNNLYNKTS